MRTPPNSVERGHRLLVDGQPRAALRAYERAVTDQPKSVSSRLGRLKALMLLGDETGSISEARFLCQLLAQRGDAERVPDIVEMVADTFPASRGLLGVFQVLVEPAIAI